MGELEKCKGEGHESRVQLNGLAVGKAQDKLGQGQNDVGPSSAEAEAGCE